MAERAERLAERRLRNRTPDHPAEEHSESEHEGATDECGNEQNGFDGHQYRMRVNFISGLGARGSLPRGDKRQP